MDGWMDNSNESRIALTTRFICYTIMYSDSLCVPSVDAFSFRKPSVVLMLCIVFVLRVYAARLHRLRGVSTV